MVTVNDFCNDFAKAEAQIRPLSGHSWENAMLPKFNVALRWAVAIVVVSLASYLILRISARGARWLSPIAMNITVRIMGLLLAAVAIQFMLNALRQLKPDLFPA